MSLSISAGSFKPITFSLDSIDIPTADKKDLVILGMYIPAHGGIQPVYERIHEKVTTATKRIDDCPLREEYKSQILSRFFLPSLQFILTVHTLGSSHLEKLDSITLRYQRKWLNLPNSATRPS